jgi:hypothetical protein
MCSEKALHTVQTWLPGFSAMHHYTKFDIASKKQGFDAMLLVIVLANEAQALRGKQKFEERFEHLGLKPGTSLVIGYLGNNFEFVPITTLPEDAYQPNLPFS